MYFCPRSDEGLGATKREECNTDVEVCTDEFKVKRKDPPTGFQASAAVGAAGTIVVALPKLKGEFRAKQKTTLHRKRIQDSQEHRSRAPALLRSSPARSTGTPSYEIEVVVSKQAPNAERSVQTEAGQDTIRVSGLNIGGPLHYVRLRERVFEQNVSRYVLSLPSAWSDPIPFPCPDGGDCRKVGHSLTRFVHLMILSRALFFHSVHVLSLPPFLIACRFC